MPQRQERALPSNSPYRQMDLQEKGGGTWLGPNSGLRAGPWWNGFRLARFGPRPARRWSVWPVARGDLAAGWPVMDRAPHCGGPCGPWPVGPRNLPVTKTQTHPNAACWLHFGFFFARWAFNCSFIARNRLLTSLSTSRELCDILDIDGPGPRFLVRARGFRCAFGPWTELAQI